MSTIGDNIRNTRKALHMSQDELAEAIGANRVTISKYENDIYLPSVPALERLASALSTTVAQLSGNADIPEAVDDEIIWKIRETLRRNPKSRILFNASTNVKAEHLEAAAAMLQALGGKDD